MFHGGPTGLQFWQALDTALDRQGILTFVDPEVNRIKKDVLVRAEFDNPRLAILPGMASEIEISRGGEIAKNDNRNDSPAVK